MKHLVWLLLLVGCGCSVFTTPSRLSIQEQDDRWETALDGVVAFLDEDLHPYCSGAWIDETHILTANHCVDGVDQAQIGLRAQFNEAANAFLASFSVLVAQRDAPGDLALVRWAGSTIPPSHTVFPLLMGPPRTGQTVFAIGHGAGQAFFFTQGRVVIPHRERDDGFFISDYTFHNAYTIPGMSGGPVINFEGELVCITSFRNHFEPVMSGCVHIDKIREITSRPSER